MYLLKSRNPRAASSAANWRSAGVGNRLDVLIVVDDEKSSVISGFRLWNLARDESAAISLALLRLLLINCMVFFALEHTAPTR
jgi:hypothetical protein